MKYLITAFIILSLNVIPAVGQDGLIIQEDSTGVCTMDGIVENSAEGFTGGGYANIDNGMGVGMSWSFAVAEEGDFNFYWRYALGGSDITSRDAGLLLNNVPVFDTVLFPHSGSSSWAEWITTDTFTLHLLAGYNKINLLSITEKGLSNIDYFHVLGSGIEAIDCVPSYTFKISSNNEAAGTFDYNPKQQLYEAGTVITLTAESNSGYIFHSWSGEEASTEEEFSFEISRNTNMEALFYSEGQETDPEATGYAIVQHDNGTPYLLNGGSAGETVTANNLQSLKTYLGAEPPYIVQLGSLIEGDNAEEITITSNKTLTGMGETAHIKGIPVKINGARNIIIRNITFSEVVQFDELEINGETKNIWIDHCEFYTDRDHDVDYYDGLLDVKNKSRYITVSWSKFHDHHKSILISSGDQEFADTAIRITFHHNYFYNCGSRVPSIRFGKAHVFNNYYRNVTTGINSRMGACVRVENNYFETTGTAVGMLYSPEPGAVELIDNEFNDAGYSNDPACTLVVPYEYTSYLHPASQVPDTVMYGTGGPVLTTDERADSDIPELKAFPNPSNGIFTVQLPVDTGQEFEISIVNSMGQTVLTQTFRASEITPGEIHISMSDPATGIYYMRLNSRQNIFTALLTINP